MSIFSFSFIFTLSSDVIIIIIILLCMFFNFNLILTDTLSLGSVWKHRPTNLMDSFEYFRRSQQLCGLYGLDSTYDFQFVVFLSKLRGT